MNDSSVILTPALRLMQTVERFPPHTAITMRRPGSPEIIGAYVAPGGYGVVTEEGLNTGRAHFTAYELLPDGGKGEPMFVWADEVDRIEYEDPNPGTVKVVTMVLTAKFVGNYYGADEVTSALESWIDSGLEDRDDLRGWNLTTVSVLETKPTPEDLA
ncbi:MAG: hypothetical protein ACRED4_09690, partial [Brevundimonas sp.]